MLRFSMLFAVALGLAGGGAAEITVSIAPDQPIPHVYVDDVLVLELRSSTDMEAEVLVTIQDPSGAEETAVDETFVLRAQGVRWIPLEDVAGPRGRYVARVRIDADGDLKESSHAFCRIDRPVTMARPPVGATYGVPDRYVLMAMRDLPLGKVCFPADHRELDALIEAAHRIGIGVGVFVDLAVTSPETARTLIGEHGEWVQHWAVAPDQALDEVAAVAAAFQGHGAQAPFALVADSPEALVDSLNAMAGRAVPAIAYRDDAPSGEALSAFKQAAQRSGHERLPLHVLGRGIAGEGPDHGAELIQNLLTFTAYGVTQADIDGELLFSENDVSEAYVFLSAFARRITRAVPIGPLHVSSPFRAFVFRLDGDWLIAAWSEGEEGELDVRVGDATVRELADVSNNPLPLPEVADGTASLTLTHEPVYMIGEGGNIMAVTARRMMQSTAQAFVSNEAHAALLPEQVAEIFDIMRENEPLRIDRSQFLALLPMFPLLEAKWHTGIVPGEVAVPAMRALSDIIRHAAVIEQDSGEPFVQPLQDTLATCAEFQQDFLLREEAPPETRGRANWLMGEVSRLVAEAKALDAIGRTIEANAVASLAQWRAHSLNATLTYVPRPSDAGDADAFDEDAPPEEDGAETEEDTTGA